MRCHYILILLIISLNSYGQKWLWGAQGYTVSDVEGWAVAADNKGNAFLAGYFRGSISFGSYNLNTISNRVNCYLAKYDSNGNVNWARQANSTSVSFCMNQAVATDGFGNSYISGQFNDTVSFGKDTLRTAMGQWDYFLVKYDVNGNEIWAKSAISAEGNSIATDASGNIYVTGQITGPTTFGTTNLSTNNGDAFIVKYDTNGNVLWAVQSFSGAVNGNVLGNSVATDKLRNVYITGKFHNTISFGPYVLTGLAGPQGDVFTTKYDSNGNVLWAKQSVFNAVLVNGNSYSVVADTNDNSYITGPFQGTASFGSYNLTSSNGDAFLVKYDPNGNVLWAKQSTNGGAGYSLAIDKFNNIYYAGGAGSTAIFCNDTLSIKTNNVSDLSLVMKIDTGGKALCGIISPVGGDDRNGIACSTNGKCIYFGGDIADTVTFGSDYLSNPGGETPFIARWQPCISSSDTSGNQNTELCNNIFVPDAFSPNKDGYNDVLYVRSDCIKTMDFMIFDRWGQKVFESTSLNNGWDGTYKGQPMNTGSFVYYLKAQLYSGATIEKKGSVALVR